MITAQLSEDDCCLPRELAHRLTRENIQALIVTSASDPHGINIVLFLDNIDKQTAIRKIREEKIE